VVGRAGGTAETFIMGWAGRLKAGMAQPTNIFHGKNIFVYNGPGC